MIAPIKKRLVSAFPIYELKITLCGSNPAIWRRVQVPAASNSIACTMACRLPWDGRTVTCTSSGPAQ
jgi:hypothetical protein